MLGRLLQHRPLALEARRALASLLEQRGRPDEARTHYEAILAESPRPEAAALAALATERLSALGRRSR